MSLKGNRNAEARFPSQITSWETLGGEAAQPSLGPTQQQRVGAPCSMIECMSGGLQADSVAV